MSNARKLQTEIERVLKKVDEGVDLFDDIWEKVYAADTANQKEKHEQDLKKEIKKLQRLRDQIKTWISGQEVRDKNILIEARKRIETKMEQFKICEKETKTKTYSKEGLARTEKLDPHEEAKQKTAEWIQKMVDQLMEMAEEADLEVERLSAGKGKKTNKHKIDDAKATLDSHKFHISKLEGIMRLVKNDLLEVEPVNDLKEDLEYYIEAHDDEDFLMGYDEEGFYETLGLEDMEVVNVDRVTHTSKDSKDHDSVSAHSDKGSKASSKDDKKKKGGSTMIPMMIGRAKVHSSSSNAGDSKDSKSTEKSSSTVTTPTKSSSSLGPTPVAAHRVAAAPPAGASMASILKREGDAQEKERQKQAALQQQLLREQQARAQQEQQQAQQLKMQQLQHAQRQQELQRQEQMRQEALKRQQLQEQQARQQAQEAAAKQQAQQQAIQRQSSGQTTGAGALDSLLSSGLGGLSLGGKATDSSAASSPNHGPSNVTQPVLPTSNAAPTPYDPSSYMSLLQDSLLTAPTAADSERQKSYSPRNPYPTPASYPTVPSQIFENPAVFEKLGVDCLFFIFYYAQGTYQQYLAARELKKQNWRYHKKYMTWFQRHEEPKITTDEYEQGTYVYFDYETGWCQRIKSDFRFEYSFLEDSLPI